MPSYDVNEATTSLQTLKPGDFNASTSSKNSQRAGHGSSWFSDLRLKLSQFSASDFFSNFGFASSSKHHHHNQGEHEKRKISTSSQQSRSVMNLSDTVVGDPVSSHKYNAYSSSQDDVLDGVRREENSRLRRRLSGAAGDDNCIFSTATVRQRSEPPNFLRGGGGRNHDDDELPCSTFERDFDVDKTIKLDNLKLDFKTCDLQNFGTLTGLVPTGKRDAGVGHVFEFCGSGYPTWCDKCGGFISGLYERQAVRCKYCRYTCHIECQPLVTLDCRSASNSLKSEASIPSVASGGDVENAPVSTADEAVTPTRTFENDAGANEPIFFHPSEPPGNLETSGDVDVVADTISSSDADDVTTPPSLPSIDQLSVMINEYNSQADGLSMTLDENGVSFHGFVQIHMNFSRPINVVAGEHPPTIYDVIASDNDCEIDHTDGRKTITTFYLPRNTVKVLHVTSDTTTSELIESLLKKFKVADNPRKFALYERDLEGGKTLQARLRRVSEDACPLRLALLCAHENKLCRFVLQENETGDINWDAFEIPELQNFLKILDIEEAQYIKQIEQRYYAYRYWLEAEIRHRLTIRSRRLSANEHAYTVEDACA